MQKNSVLLDGVSFEKRLMKHKQKKPFVYFNNELTEVMNSFFQIGKSKLFCIVTFFLENVAKIK